MLYFGIRRTNTDHGPVFAPFRLLLVNSAARDSADILYSAAASGARGTAVPTAASVPVLVAAPLVAAGARGFLPADVLLWVMNGKMLPTVRCRHDAKRVSVNSDLGGARKRERKTDSFI
jgi:hypothetical protein